jgi:hypothetical protein
LSARYIDALGIAVALFSTVILVVIPADAGPGKIRVAEIGPPEIDTD